MEKKILIFGEIVSDYMILAEDFIHQGCSLLLGEKEMPGGCALNTALVLHGWKIPLFFWGNALGQDALGEKILSHLKEIQLPHQIFLSSDFSTPRCLCLVSQKKGTRSFLVSNPHRREFDLSYPLDFSLFSHAFVDASMGDPSHYVLKALENTSCQTFTQDISPQSSFLGKTNVVQLSISPEKFHLQSLRKKALLYLHGKTEWVIFTGGEKGALAFHRNEILFEEPLPCHPVDTTGCGDAFRAGLMYGLYQGHSFSKALFMASWAGAKIAEIFGSNEILPVPPLSPGNGSSIPENTYLL